MSVLRDSLVFALIPWVLYIVGDFMFFPLVYFSLIFLFPLSRYPYHFGWGRPTLFHPDTYGLLSQVIYSLLLGIAAAYLLRCFNGLPRKIAAPLAFVLAVVIGFFVSHFFAWLQGYEFMLE